MRFFCDTCVADDLLAGIDALTFSRLCYHAAAYFFPDVRPSVAVRDIALQFF